MSARRSALETGVAFALVSAVAGLGGALTDLGPWYFSLLQPAWKPPDTLFGIAWTGIFICIGVAGVVAWRKARTASDRRRLGWALGLNAVLNVGWSALFFGLQRPDWALIEVVLLWLSILFLVATMSSYSRTASALMVPYLLWVSAAGFLNAAVVQLNGPFDAALLGLHEVRV